jgi:hypothetical protein
MLSSLWESLKYTSHLLFRVGYVIGLLGTALVDWLKAFPFMSTWVLGWAAPRFGVVLLAHLVTNLPPWAIFILVFVPPALSFGVIFLSFLAALARF